MEQECHSKVNISNGIIINSMNNSNATNPNNTNGMVGGGPNENVSMQVIPMGPYRKEPLTIGSPLVKMFATNDTKDTSQSIRNASCFKSKVNSNGRRIADASLRMRPYFIPERSRTKSENSIELEAYSNFPCTNGSNGSNLISVDAINSNSNSMMETCDAYLNSDFSGPSSSSNFPNWHILNSNQYFKPIKTHSLTGQIKKSRSLENIRAENIDGSQPSHEMEFVSSRIQKLHVNQDFDYIE